MLLCDLTLGAMASQAVASTCSDQSRPFKHGEAGLPRLWVSSVLSTFDVLQMCDNKFGDYFKPNGVPYEMRYNESGCTHMIICCGNVHLLIMQ